MTSEELKRNIKLALTENPDKCITPKELEDAMIKTVDYVDETKTSLEKYVDEKLADVPDAPETPETPETPDAPGCECEPVEKKEPYVIVVEDIFNIPVINNREEVNKVREALTDGSGVIVRFTNVSGVDDLFISGYETREANSLDAIKHIRGYIHNTYSEWDVYFSAQSGIVTIGCNLTYFRYDYTTEGGYSNLHKMLRAGIGLKVKGKIDGPVSINGTNDYYSIIIDTVWTAGSDTVVLVGKILNLDYGRNVTLSINGKGEMSATIDTEIKTKELYFNDGSDKLVPIRHPDLSTQPSILPYKFAGNYVYEQMFYIDNVDRGMGVYAISFAFPPAEGDELPVIIDCNISVELSWDGKFTEVRPITNARPYISSDTKTFGIDFNDAVNKWASEGYSFNYGWVRLVWTKKPDTSGGDDYYYQQQQGNGVPCINIMNYVEKDVVAVFHGKGDGYIFKQMPLAFRDKLLLTGQELTEFINRDYFITFDNPNEVSPEKGADFRLSIDGSDEYLTGGTVTTDDGDQILNAIDINNLQSSCPKAYNMLMKGNTIYFTLEYIAI